MVRRFVNRHIQNVITTRSNTCWALETSDQPIGTENDAIQQMTATGHYTQVPVQ